MSKEEEKKKSYVKPNIDKASVFESAGRTCCRVTMMTCGGMTGQKGVNMKMRNRRNVS